MVEQPRSTRLVLLAYVLAPTLFGLLLPWRTHLLASVVMTALLVFPFNIARGILRVEKNAFWGIFAHAGSMLGLSCFVAILAPPVFLVSALTALSCSLAAVFFLQADQRRPFLNEEPRGFRRHPRYPRSVAAKVKVNDSESSGHTLDLSLGGAYVAIDNHEGPLPALHSKIVVELSEGGECLRCPARVVGVYPNGREPYQTGISVHFQALTERDEDTIEHLIKHGREVRPLVQVPVEIYANNATYRSSTMELSSEGCFLSKRFDTLAPGDKIVVKLRLPFTNTVECAAEIVWSDPAHSPGSALRFMRLSKSETARVRQCVARATGERAEFALGRTGPQKVPAMR